MTSVLPPRVRAQARQLAELWARPSLARNPVAWFWERTRRRLWSKQQEVVESVRDNRFTAVPSCHGAGKSFLGGGSIGWWIDTHTLGEAFAISTAPSAAQVSSVLWREAGRFHRDGKLPGRITTAGYPQWKIHDGPDGLVAYGRKPSDYSESTFQGIHAREGVLIVVDEAAGVAANLFQQIDSIVSNGPSRVLLIGNPTDPSSYFAQACKPGSKYHVIRIDALRLPTMTREAIEGRLRLVQALMEWEGIPYSTEPVPDEMRDSMSSAEWVEECIQDWCGVAPTIVDELPWELVKQHVADRCIASPVFTARVRGQFPTVDEAATIPAAWVEAAFARWDNWKAGQLLYDDRDEMVATPAGQPVWLVEPGAEPEGRRIVGVDVAREGLDRTVLAIRQGTVVLELIPRPRQDVVATARDVAAQLTGVPQAFGVIDAIGLGAGVYDILRDKGYDVRPFVASGQSGRLTPDRKMRFRNDRAAAWWHMRTLLDPSRGHNIALPRNDDLLVELSAPRWGVLEGSPVIFVESKDDVRKRLRRSTDYADAVIQSFWFDGGAIDPVTPTPARVGSRQEPPLPEGAFRYEMGANTELESGSWGDSEGWGFDA
jgi:hypothetical protein